MLWHTARHWLFVVILLQFYNAWGKDLLLPKCVKIVSINIPLDDPTRAAENYGVKANKKKASLSNSPGVFKIHKGLTQDNGTVSLEALYHPRYFLRHKNYHFHLEKKFNNSMFRKDATFYILKVTEHPPLFAFELYSHPTWFMRHLKQKPYKIVLRKVNEASKEVMDSTFYLAPEHCSPSEKKHELAAVKKTVLVGDGTFIDTADEDADIASARANDVHVEDFEKNWDQIKTASDDDNQDGTIKIHTEDEEAEIDDQKPITIHTENDVTAHPAEPAPTAGIPQNAGKGASEESNDDIVKEIEEAFRIAQKSNNSSYLEKIEKDIEDKVNKIAASASDEKTNSTDSDEGLDTSKIKTVDDIEIHTEADETPQVTQEKDHGKTNIHTETDPPEQKKEKSSIDRVSQVVKRRKHVRVEVLGPVVERGQVQDNGSYIGGYPGDVDKDIVVTGKPKLSGKVIIETTFKQPHHLKKKENYHIEKLTGFNIDDVQKSKLNGTAEHVGMKLPQRTHSRHHKAYHDYSEAHKVLSSNIENLRKVLKAIEDVPARNLKDQGIEMVKKAQGEYHAVSPQTPATVITVPKQQVNMSDAPLHIGQTGAPLVNQIPPYLPQPDAANYHVLKSQSSTQTTVSNLPQAPVLPQRPGTVLLANRPQVKQETNPATPLLNTAAPGLHVVQTSGAPVNNNATNQADVTDRFNAELVDSSNAGSNAGSNVGSNAGSNAGSIAGSNAGSNVGTNVGSNAGSNVAGHVAPTGTVNSAGQARQIGAGTAAGHFVNESHPPHPQNKSLQETFKELSPEDTAKIFYLGECKDEFPKACEDWAAKRYCLTFSELMKRYCRKACKLCNHVLATGFTACDKTCGGGVRLRMIKVNNRQVLQRRSCNINSCPINGGYTPYSDWSECSVTCGEGVRYRHRSCNDPKPQFGGFDCNHFGPPVDTRLCFKTCKDSGGIGKQHFSDSMAPKKRKHHSSDHLGSEDFPEYTAEESNPKATEPVGESDTELENEERIESGSANQPSEYGADFKWPNKHTRRKPLILHHVHKNVFKHKDHHGNHHLLHIDKEKHPSYEEQPSYEEPSYDDQVHTHVVRYKGQQVAKMECGPSQLLQYHKHVANHPDRPGYKKRSPSYKMFDAGELVYDKYGLPTDTTKNIVQAFDSPYKIILQRNKNNQMKIMEQCIESDASVNPDSELRAGQFSNFAPNSNALEGEQRSLTASSRTPDHPMDHAVSNGYAANGLYEYKYEDIGQGYTAEGEKQIDKDVSDQLTKAFKHEAAEISQRSERNREAKPTLREQLAVDKDEAIRERDYENMLAKKSGMSNSG